MTRSKSRGPNRATLLKEAEEHEAAMEQVNEELEQTKTQIQALVQVPPLIFTIVVNRVTGRIVSVPQIGESSPVEDLRLLLKALNAYQSNVVDALADKATTQLEDGEVLEEEAEEDLDDEIEEDPAKNVSQAVEETTEE